MSNSIAGVILAGGLATRLGGKHKGLLDLAPKVRLLDEVARRLSGQVKTVALNANRDPDLYSDFDMPILPDSIEGFVGPLAGVLAGMEWAASEGFESIVSVAADTPFFPSDLVAELSREKGPLGLAIAGSRDATGKFWRQPTFGLWPVALRGELREALTSEGLRKIVVWTDRNQAGLVEFPYAPDGGDPFFNVNTPEDLQTAREIYERQATL